MKRMFCVMMLGAIACASMAQNSAIKKARAIFDESLVNEQYTDASGNKAQKTVIDFAKLDQAQEILTPVFTNEKTKDFAQAWDLQSEIYLRHMSSELNKAANKEPLDTLKFYTYLNKTLDALYETMKVDNEKGLYRIKAQQNMKQFRDYYLYCGQFFSSNGDNEKAYDAFKTWLDFPQKYSQLEQSYIEESLNGRDPAMVAYYAAMTAYQAKQYDKMEQHREQALAYGQDAGNVRQLFLVATLEKGDTTAWENMAIGFVLDGTAPDGLVQNIMAHFFNMGDNDKVISFAKQLCENRPEDKFGPYAQGLVAMNADNYEEAIKWFDDALAIDAEYFDALYNAGVCYCNWGYTINDALNGKKMTKAENDKELEKVRDKYRSAEPYFLKIRELRPDEPNRWANRLRTIYYILDNKEKEKEMDAFCD